MADKILVATSVHPPDDPRIRYRTVDVLARSFAVRYACPAPGPTGAQRFDTVTLPGGRLRRLLAVMREAWRDDVALVSIHDPELIPVGLAARLLRRRGVVFDLHEDLPAQLTDKSGIPTALRRSVEALAHRLLMLAERHLWVTLAEEGYQRLFRKSHLVLPNYLQPTALSEPREDEGFIVYLGDVTEPRGALLLIEAVAMMAEPRPVLFIGRCREPLRSRMLARAATRDVQVEWRDFTPHPEAMKLVAGAAVGVSPLLGAPNHRHALPTKTLEYLAQGVPVIASDLPGTARVIGSLEAVRLVRPGSASALAHALDEVCGSQALRDAAARQAPAIRERFAWPEERLTAFYGRLMEQVAG